VIPVESFVFHSVSPVVYIEVANNVGDRLHLLCDELKPPIYGALSIRPILLEQYRPYELVYGLIIFQFREFLHVLRQKEGASGETTMRTNFLNAKIFLLLGLELLS